MLRALTLFVAGVTALGLMAQDVPEGVSKDSPSSGAFLGVVLGKVPEELAAHLDVEGGSMILEVLPGSPAAAAGLKRHDVIVSMGGEKVRSAASVTGWIHSRKAGEKVVLKVVSRGEAREVEVRLGSRPPAKSAPALEAPVKTPGFLGVQFEPVPEVLAVHLQLEQGRGAVIVQVFEDSPAARAGLKVHDVVLAVDGKAVEGGDIAARLAGKLEGDEVTLDTIQRGEHREIHVTLGARPHDLPRAINPWPFRALPVPGTGQHGLQVPPRFRGRFYLQGPDGEERAFDLPEWSGKLKGLGPRLEKELQEHFSQLPQDMQKNLDNLEQRLKDLAEKFESSAGDLEFDLDLGDLKDLGQSGTQRLERSSVRSKTRVVQGGYDIEIVDDNGRRTVSVERNGKVLATDLPIDKLDQLDADAQKRVHEILDQNEPGSRLKLRLKIDENGKKGEKSKKSETSPREPKNVEV